MLGGAVAGTNVTEKTALQVAAVYGSVGVLSDATSTLPLGLLSSTDAAKRKQLPPSPLLTQPYSEISLTDFLCQFTISLALRGNFYGQIISRDENLYPTQIKPIHPDHVRVQRMPDGSIQYRFYGATIATRDVFHVRYLSVPGAIVGLNPIEYLKNAIGLARAADLYGASFFQNSAMPSGVIELEGDLDEDEVLDLAQSWKQAHQGIGQANLPAILTGGAKFNPISITPDDAQFLQSRQFSQGEIAGMIFRVPPHMIGIVDRTTSWGTGIEQQEMGFVRTTLAGYLTRFENAMTALHPPGQYVRFDLKSRLRGDTLQRFQAYSLGRLGGWLSANDIRRFEDEPPIENGDEYLVPINSQLLEAAVAQSTAMQEQINNPQAGATGGSDAGSPTAGF